MHCPLFPLESARTVVVLTINVNTATITAVTIAILGDATTNDKGKEWYEAEMILLYPYLN
jgi:hypothetical protein